MTALGSAARCAAAILALAAGCGGGGDGGGDGGSPPISTLRSLSAGSYHSAALQLDGTLWIWGSNDACQLALPAGTSLETRPLKVAGTEWVAVAAGGQHTLAIAQHGTERTLWGWGLNLSGQAGHWYLDAPVNHPERIGTGAEWDSVAAGLYHSAAVRRDGTLWTWGWNTDGQLGIELPGGETITSSPTQVLLDPTSPTPDPLDGSWAKVTAGQFHTLALQRGGALFAWGENAHGQLGILSAPVPFPPNEPLPVRVPGAWLAVSAGGLHTLAIRSDGTLWAWGNDDFGQVGNGAVTGAVFAPVQIDPRDGWAEVSAGRFHSTAIRQDGTLWAWGDGVAVGDGAHQTRYQPVEVQPGSRWLMVSAGGSHTLGVKGADGLQGWGDNGYGQLGIGSHDDKDAPASVPLLP